MTREFWENYILEVENENKGFDWWGWMKDIASTLAMTLFILSVGFVLWSVLM